MPLVLLQIQGMWGLMLGTAIGVVGAFVAWRCPSLEARHLHTTQSSSARALGGSG